ncbi:hypothetical protein [Streptomyces sp. NPDC003832]
MARSDDYARTSARLTTCGCLAGLVVALSMPLYMLVAMLFEMTR